jgi:hypothetical protein
MNKSSVSVHQRGRRRLINRRTLLRYNVFSFIECKSIIRSIPHSTYHEKIPHLAFRSLTTSLYVKNAGEIYGYSHTWILFTETIRGYIENDRLDLIKTQEGNSLKNEKAIFRLPFLTVINT